jgi:hypothetical protein
MKIILSALSAFMQMGLMSRGVSASLIITHSPNYGMYPMPLSVPLMIVV